MADLIHGQGTFTWADGDVDKGRFENDKFMVKSRPPPLCCLCYLSFDAPPTHPPTCDFQGIFLFFYCSMIVT